MRRIEIFALAGIALIAVAAAQSVGTSTRSFSVDGFAPDVCAVQNGVIAQGTTVNFIGLNGTMLQIDKLVDPSTLSTRAASVEVDFPAVCTFPHRISLESTNNGLWRREAGVGTAPDNFADAVPYSVQILWSDIDRRLDADTSTRSPRTLTANVDQPAQGSVRLLLAVLPGASNLRNGSPLIAGVYEDTLRLRVEPQ